MTDLGALEERSQNNSRRIGKVEADKLDKSVFDTYREDHKEDHEKAEAERLENERWRRQVMLAMVTLAITSFVTMVAVLLSWLLPTFGGGG